MCGIAGFCDFGKKSSRDTLQQMTNVLEHRGPDSAGYEFFTVQNAQIGLGHRRLSILDLSDKASQPMKDESGNHVIILNGEIYNYRDIRQELEREGFTFFSTSDTEVVLKAYIRWGLNAVHKFIGMFAFVLYDKATGKIYLFRDRAGVKPLYYYYEDSIFLFASELKSFHQAPRFRKRLSSVALSIFFRFGYVPTPNTIFERTYKLRPGHYLELDVSTKSLREVKYWDVYDYYNKPILNISKPEAIEEMETVLKSAFAYRMVSDVPVGLFLSGGYDSTAVTAMLQSTMTDKLKTFTIGFEDKRHNEANEASKVASYLGTDHTEYYCTDSDAKELLRTWPYFYDEPFADTSAIPTMLISKLAREKVTVALSGDGADETFAGYGHTQYYVRTFRKIQRTPAVVKRIINTDTKFIADATRHYNGFNWYIMAVIDRFWRLRNFYALDSLISIITRSRCPDYKLFRLLNSSSEIGQTLCQNFSLLNEDMNVINKCLAIDYQNYMLDDILTKVDRATMSVGLEGREPLLDHRIVELAARLPVNFKYDNGVKKKILREIVHKYVPERLMNRPKKGFGAPVRKWLREDLKEYVHDYLANEKLRKHDLFDVNYVAYVRNAYLRAGREYSAVWPILVFQMWYEQWMD